MAQIENLPQKSMSNLSEREKLELILEVRKRRREVANKPKKTKKQLPKNLIAGMTPQQIDMILEQLQGAENGSTGYGNTQDSSNG